jgi:hypothetical protein
VAIADEKMLSALDEAIKHSRYLVGNSANTLAPTQKYLAKNCVTHNYTSLDLFLITGVL